MLRVLFIIVVFLYGLYMGYVIRLERYDLAELIWAMEYARESHQAMVDNPEHFALYKQVGLVKSADDERRWVEVYGRVIDALRR